ncbi:hypothetical protein BC835DRAFT_1414024 [Cytidiella melzeri]|nr:hypothetical protein BC835DRAFT_1414024 [Cytidiella melzeri]
MPYQSLEPLGLVDHNGDQIMLQGEHKDTHPNTSESQPLIPPQADLSLAYSPTHAPHPQDIQKNVTQTLFAQPPHVSPITT